MDSPPTAELSRPPQQPLPSEEMSSSRRLAMKNIRKTVIPVLSVFELMRWMSRYCRKVVSTRCSRNRGIPTRSTSRITEVFLSDANDVGDKIGDKTDTGIDYPEGVGICSTVQAVDDEIESTNRFAVVVLEVRSVVLVDGREFLNEHNLREAEGTFHRIYKTISDKPEKVVKYKCTPPAVG